MISFALDQEQEMLKKSARDFMERECPEKVVREIERSETGHSAEIWRKMADLGWLGIVFPERYGGTGGSILDLVALSEEMGRAMLPSPYLSTVALCGLVILAAGSEEQKKEILPKIVKGDLILSLALTEDSAGWDCESISIRATPDGSDFVINGAKLFVHDAHIADYLVVVTRTAGTTSPDGITLFLVDAKSQGIKCTVLDSIGGTGKQSEVIFNNVRVPGKNMVGRFNRGWPPLANVLQKAAVALSGEMVGASQKLLELGTEYAKTRVQFDNPIGVNQYMQEQCVFMLVKVEGSRWTTYQAAWRLSMDLPADMEVAIAKAWTGEAYEEVCWHAHRVLSGIGSVIETGILPLHTERARVSQLYLGDSAYHRKKIARQLDAWNLEMPTGKPLGLWDKDPEPAWP